VCAYATHLWWNRGWTQIEFASACNRHKVKQECAGFIFVTFACSRSQDCHTLHKCDAKSIKPEPKLHIALEEPIADCEAMLMSTHGQCGASSELKCAWQDQSTNSPKKPSESAMFFFAMAEAGKLEDCGRWHSRLGCAPRCADWKAGRCVHRFRSIDAG